MVMRRNTLPARSWFEENQSPAALIDQRQGGGARERLATLAIRM
jgi:hypothetical protein